MELEQSNLEYKMILNQKIKDLAVVQNFEQRELIIDIYTKLEQEKMDTIIKLKKLLEKEEEQIVCEKIEEFHTAIDYFDNIINCEEPSKIMLENLIETVWIYHDKSVRFDLKPDIKSLV